MSTLLNEITNWLETRLNTNSFNVVFDMGYLFERDEMGFTRVVNSQTNQYLKENVPFIPSMFGAFTPEWNKPQNYQNSGQLSKSGSTSLYFSLPDPNDQKELYDNTLKALEEFENNLAGLRQADGKPIEIEVDTTSDPENPTSLTYTLSINSSPGQASGLVKFGAGWRTLFAIGVTLKAGIGMGYGEDVITEIKEFGANDDTYVQVEIPSLKNALQSTPELFQEDQDKESNAGLTNTVYNKTIILYYPKGDENDFPDDVKNLIVSLFRRVEDPNFKPQTKYTIRTTYPDFVAVRDFKYKGGVPNTEKGLELSIKVEFVPYKVPNQ